MRLQDRTALITGAARGIGEAIAAAFIREGARVLLTDIDAPALDETAQRLSLPKLKLDVREEADWADAEAWVNAHWDGLDILVNNAGVTGFLETPGPHDPEHLDLASWRAVMAVNADGTALGCRTAIRLMKARKTGSIINLSSRSGIVGIPGAAAYAASKAAVRNHTKTVALYCAEQGWAIRCNSIHPAAVMTPMWDAMLGEGEQRAAIIADVEAGVPLKRFGRAEEVAETAVYLASDAAAYVTGSEIHIDGGILAGASAAPAKAE